METWWRFFGKEWEPKPIAVKQGDNLIGIAPLMLRGKTARIIGSPDVCDYLDFVVAPGRGQDVLKVLLLYLKRQEISNLDLGPLRADSSLFTDVASVAKVLGYEQDTVPEDVTLEMKLPAGWEEFLAGLPGKQRHEIRRKQRRLHEAGQIKYRVVTDRDEVRATMPIFLDLFVSTSSPKAAFMTDQMASFFRSLAEKMADRQLVKLFFLFIEGAPAATAICFDYNDTMYLYNNGYDDKFRSLSMGLLSKVFSIRESIGMGRKKFEFLKGNETYKYRLGGEPVPLYRCKLRLGY